MVRPAGGPRNRRNVAVAVRAGPRVSGERLRAAEEHQPAGVPEPEQQQPGRDVEVAAGAAGRLQPERRDRRRGREKQRRRSCWTFDQAQQVVRERSARAARQHAQRRHTVARRPEAEAVAAVGPPALQQRCRTVRQRVVLAASRRVPVPVQRDPVPVQRVLVPVRRVVLAAVQRVPVQRVPVLAAVRRISVPVPRLLPVPAVQRLLVQERQRNVPGKPLVRRSHFVQGTDVLLASAQSRN